MEGFSRGLAFLIGIDAYRNGIPELHTPVADARSLAEVLGQQHGFETKVLVDADATLASLRGLLSGLRNEIGPDDRVLFYFAGHGIATDSKDGPRGFVLPQDARNGT